MVINSERLIISLNDDSSKRWFAEAKLKDEVKTWIDRALGDENIAEATIDLSDHEAYINRIDAYRSTYGYGRELLSSILDHLQEEGFRRVKAYVERDNFKSRSMFEKLGFKEDHKGATPLGSYWELDFSLKETSVRRFLNEEIYMKDLNGNKALSGITTSTFDYRMTDPNAKSGIDFVEAVWKTNIDVIDIALSAESTKGYGTKSSPHGDLSPTNDYGLLIRFLKVSAQLGQPTAWQPNPQAIATMIQTCPIQLYSDDPSFYYQGVYEDLAKVGGSAKPFVGTPGDGVWHAKHAASGGLANPDVRLTKHLQQGLDTLPSLVNQITSSLVIR